MKTVTAFAAIALMTSAASATTYYVSNTGSDKAVGTSTTAPWQTIAKVNASQFNSGDQILFQRGGTWREMLVPPTGGLTFGVYGTGTKPIISGANVLATGWTQKATNVWSYAFGSYQPTNVWFNGVQGTQVSAYTAIYGPGEWAYTGTTLYVYSSSNPGTAYTSPGVEATERDWALEVNAIGSVTVQSIVFENASYADGYVVSNASGTQTFTSDQFQGAAYEGLLVQGGTTQISGSIFVNNDEGIGVSGGNGMTLTNSVISGNTTDAIEIYGTSGASTIQSSTITGNATANSTWASISNWSDYALKADNSVLLPNPYYPAAYSFTGLTDDGTNVYSSPQFAQRAAPLIVVPFVDDYNNLSVAQAVASAAKTYGCTLSYALNTKLVTAADWKTIASMQAAGTDIVAHTRSHSDLANNSVFTIQYTGTASTATMTINQTSGTLQTFLNGSTTPDLNISTSNTYDYVGDVCSEVTANSNYTCVVETNQTYFTPAILANVSKVNIKTAYVTQAASNYLSWEIQGSMQDIEANIPGYTPKAFATPFTSSNASVEAEAQSVGFVSQRNGSLTANDVPDGNWLFSNLDIYNLASEWLPTQFNTANIPESTAALVEGLGASGGVFAVYAHGYDEFTLAQWESLFQALQQIGAQCMTFTQATNYIQTHGTLLTDGTKKNWVQLVPLQPNFATTTNSPSQGAHNLQP